MPFSSYNWFIDGFMYVPSVCVCVCKCMSLKVRHFAIHFDIVQRFIAVKFSSLSDSHFGVIVPIGVYLFIDAAGCAFLSFFEHAHTHSHSHGLHIMVSIYANRARLLYWIWLINNNNTTTTSGVFYSRHTKKKLLNIFDNVNESIDNMHFMRVCVQALSFWILCHDKSDTPWYTDTRKSQNQRFSWHSIEYVLRTIFSRHMQLSSTFISITV